VSAWVEELLAEVGLTARHAERFPHELSGGERQRAALARAMATRPDLLIADEPVSALDAAVKLQVVDLLAGLRARRRLAILLIAHELAVLGRVADRIAVLHRGRLVELGPAPALLRAPSPPYGEALVRGRVEAAAGRAIEGDASGCLYRADCAQAFDRCADERPAERAVGPGWTVACHAREAVHTGPDRASEVEPFPSGDVE